MKTDFDYIVVGAGSAGCALAYRLAERGDAEVLLVEAGSAARNPMIHIPLGFAFLLKEHKNNWHYLGDPEPGLGNRRVEFPRGRVLGGCSAINGMVYVRGQREDYDGWAAAGNEGWSWSDVEFYFRRAEAGPNPVYGDEGPLPVTYVEHEFPICDAFVAAAEAAGHPFNEELNGETQAGVSRFPTNILRGRRQTAAKAYLSRHILPNLTVHTGTHVERLIFDGHRVTGAAATRAGKPVTLQARRELILSAGAINSPKLLELSGIGERQRLQALGIEVKQNLPGVGENLQDHWNGYIKQAVKSGASYFTESKPLAMLRNLFRYLFRREGFLGYPAALIAVFYAAKADSTRPDAQIHFAPAASERDARGNMVPIDAITVASCGIRPASRGATHIENADPSVAPKIRINFLEHPHDRDIAIAAFRRARDILAQPPFDEYRGRELEPGEAVQSDEDILEYLRATGEPVHHLAGSCRMGNDDSAVVDARLRVRGIDGLRVADASIMPSIVSGNTHAACVMIGEKAADMLLEDWRD